MKISKLIFPAFVLLCLTLPAMSWQDTQKDKDNDDARRTAYPASMTERTTKAVDYKQDSTSHIDMKGTNLMPEAKGEVKVHTRTGRIEIEAKLDHMRPPNSLGLEYLSYVLWAIGPDGRPNNLGEMVLKDGDESSIATTTPLALPAATTVPM